MTPVAPMLADQAQANRSRFLSLSCRVDLLPQPSLSSSVNMAPVMESTMGTIRAIEAALEIHMERNIVTSMKPGIKEITKRAAIRNRAHVRDKNKTCLTQKNEPLAGPDSGDHVEAESVMEAAVLHGDGHDKAADKHHVGALNILKSRPSFIIHIDLEVEPGHLVSGGHPGQGQHHQGQQRGDGEGEQLQDPEHGHHFRDRVMGVHCTVQTHM